MKEVKEVMSKNAKYHEWLTKEGLVRLGGWARDGLDNKQMANNMGITPSTFYEWQKKFPQISDTIKGGKDAPDREVENAMYKSAIGFEYTEEMVSNTGEVVEVRKYSKPNTTAQIFWLKNRKPADWRDRQEIEQTNRNIEIDVGEWDED